MPDIKNVVFCWTDTSLRRFPMSIIIKLLLKLRNDFIGFHSHAHHFPVEDNRLKIWIYFYTMSFCIEVTLAAGSYVSFAGITEILYYKSSESRVYNVEGGWNIPANLSADEILPYHTTKPNGANVLVPGFFAGIYTVQTVFDSI